MRQSIEEARECIANHAEIREALASFDYAEVLDFLWADAYIAGEETVASFIASAAVSLRENRKRHEPKSEVK
jgi:hypothetical protein